MVDYGAGSASCSLPQAWGSGGLGSLFSIPLADLGVGPGTYSINRIQWAHQDGSAAYNTTITLDNVQFA